MLRDWARNPLNNDVMYCGSLSDGHIRIYKNLDRPQALSVMRHLTKEERKIDRHLRGLQLLTATGKDFPM